MKEDATLRRTCHFIAWLGALSTTTWCGVTTLAADKPAARSRETVTARGQSPAPSRQRVNPKQQLAEARQEFNSGRLTEAESLARACQQSGMRAPLFGDSADKLLEDIAENRQIEQAWKKDSQSEAARRQRVAYFLKRARQVAEEGDGANAERYVRLADAAGLQGEGPLQSKLALAKRLMASRVAVARGSSAGEDDASLPAVDEAALLEALESNDEAAAPQALKKPARAPETRVKAGVAPRTQPADEDVAPAFPAEEEETPVAADEAVMEEEPADEELAADTLPAESEEVPALPREVAEESTGEEVEEPLGLTDDLPAGAVEDDPSLPADELTDAPVEAVEEPRAVPPSPASPSALQWYRDGKQALRNGDRDAAYELYMKAYKSGQKLSPRETTEIREFLSTHGATKVVERQSAAPATAEESSEESAVADAADRRQAAYDKLRTDVRNAKYKAEKLAETDPDGAMQILQSAQEAVEGANLDAKASAPLLKSLAASRQQVDYARKVNGPRIDLEQRTEEVLSTVKRERDFKISVEKEFAEKVDEFNELMREKRFEEAEVVAKQAQQLKPGEEVAELMVLKSRFGARAAHNDWLKERLADEWNKQLDDLEKTITDHPFTTDIAYDIPKFKKITQLRSKYKDNASNYFPSEAELKVQQSLKREVSLNFEDAPLSTVVKHLQTLAEINVHLDPEGLEEEGVTPSTTVSIHLEGVQMKSALKHLLDPLRLGYVVVDGVLKITSSTRQQGELVPRTYSVADLVIPVQNFTSPDFIGRSNKRNAVSGSTPAGMGLQSVPSNSQTRLASKSGQGFAQIDEVPGGTSGLGGAGRGKAELEGGGVVADFTELIDLIQTTVAPSTWESLGGVGQMRPFNTTLSLVIRQTQSVHEEIADLLRQLRRLQDLQVTVECRFITVSDSFFERIGIDFDFNLNDCFGNGSLPNTFGQPLPPYGIGQTVGLAQAGTQGQGGQQGGQAGQAGQAAQAGSTGTGPFTQNLPRDLINRDSYGRYGAVVGLLPTGTFNPSLDIPFQQGSFAVGVPQFGGFQASAGMTMGMAILSDIETFFLINAAQGDQRTNIMYAPKVTLFNGQIATVSDQRQIPFVTNVIPVVGFGSVGFQPVITMLPDGISLTVLAVISADRRYVRLSLSPLFSAVTRVDTFQSASGGAGFGGQGGGGGQGGLGGGGGGGLGGGGFGGQGGGGFGGGFGGIGGFGGQGGQGGGQGGLGGGQGGLGGGQGGQGGQGGGGLNVTLQQPSFQFTQIQTTVSVPDGGTVLLGGVKRLKEGRTMAGVPILNKIPYLSRLFKNTGVGRDAESVMLMVTPRIIIQEEEEELLGVEQ